jgi:uncharacterized membrane protein YeaQ/YmgE (transglycosylase-associated protein family)
MDFLGPFCFGLVIGWVTYRTLRRKAEGVALGDIASVLGAIGGATIVALFKNAAFNSYCIGLAVGFFAYFITGALIGLKKGTDASANTWMGSRDSQ